ncbi:hypothetical protein DBL01_03130 [Acinetobacter pittii]|nr:hypothetical protein DBL01_03130 [Acinetobacter pittii]
MRYNIYYVFLIIPIACIVLIEFYIRFFQFNIARHDKKMRLIRSLELAFFSPFLTIGMLRAKGENVDENFWLVIMLTTVFIGLLVRNYLDYKKDS